jgi:hypothetical protein
MDGKSGMEPGSRGLYHGKARTGVRIVPSMGQDNFGMYG